MGERIDTGQPRAQRYLHPRDAESRKSSEDAGQGCTSQVVNFAFTGNTYLARNDDPLVNHNEPRPKVLADLGIQP